MRNIVIKNAFLITLLCLSNLAGATTHEPLENTKREKAIDISEWIIEPKLLRLIDRINMASNLGALTAIKSYMEKLSSRVEIKKLNPAERYVYIAAKTLLMEKDKQFQLPSVNAKQYAKSIIKLLSQLKVYSAQISEAQLNQVSFIELQLQLHTILSTQYAVLKQYNLAYLEKASYINKYDVYKGNKRNEMIKQLSDNLGINEKKLVNDTLTKNNDLTVKQVNEVERDKTARQNKFIISITVALIFIAIFIKQLTVRRQLIKLAKTDSLTGLLNRSALFEHGYSLAKYCREKPYDFSVLLLDLDDFKLINDRYGHHIGDEVLKTVSLLANEAMRSRDIFARLGGEEFVALLPYADDNKAKAIAQRINEKVLQYDFTTKGIKAPITLSIGVATMNTNHARFDDTLHCADLAMYEAKALGKNRILSYHNIPKSREKRAI